MKYRAFSQWLMIGYFVSSFLIAWVSKDYWLRSGEDWAYWVGRILTLMISIFTGLALIILNMVFYHPNTKVERFRRVIPVLFGVFLVVVGVLLLINQLQQLSAGCPAPGCMSVTYP